MNELRYFNYQNRRRSMYCKVTKLSVRDDSENQKNNDELESINNDIANEYSKIPGFISGGTYAVTEGMTFEGNVTELPEKGDCLRVSGREWLRTSPVEEVTLVKDGEWLVKTMNSMYRVQKLGD